MFMKTLNFFFVLAGLIVKKKIVLVTKKEKNIEYTTLTLADRQIFYMYTTSVYLNFGEFDPCSRQNLLNPKRSSITHNLSLSTFHRPDMTEVLLKRT